MHQTAKSLCLLTIFVAALPAALAVQFTHCSNSNTARQVLIEGCDTETGESLTRGGPCYIPRGRNLWFRAMFISNANYPQVETDVRARIGFIERPISSITDTVEADACKNYLKCPLEKNAPYWVNTTFSVPTVIPKFAATVTLRLLSPVSVVAGNQVDPVITCGQTKVQLY